MAAQANSDLRALGVLLPSPNWTGDAVALANAQFVAPHVMMHSLFYSNGTLLMSTSDQAAIDTASRRIDRDVREGLGNLRHEILDSADNALFAKYHAFASASYRVRASNLEVARTFDEWATLRQSDKRADVRASREKVKDRLEAIQRHGAARGRDPSERWRPNSCQCWDRNVVRIFQDLRKVTHRARKKVQCSWSDFRFLRRGSSTSTVRSDVPRRAGCGKSARPDLWGPGAFGRATRLRSVYDPGETGEVLPAQTSTEASTTKSSYRRTQYFIELEMHNKSGGSGLPITRSKAKLNCVFENLAYTRII